MIEYEYLSSRFYAALVYGAVTAFSLAVARIIQKKGQARYVSLIPHMGKYLLLALFIPIITEVLGSRRLPITFVANGFLSAVLCTLLLLVLTPLLRRIFSAEGCALLWLIPGYGCFFCMLFSSANGMLPLRVLWLPRWSWFLIFGLWAAGFLGVLFWKIRSHFLFRKSVLRDAELAPEAEQAILSGVQKGLSFQKKYQGGLPKLYRSPAATAPLSVGLIDPCLVLPCRDYSPDELRMIFWHELLHLYRGDNRTKLDLTIICAAGWFLPSLWLGINQAAEDLELCCDEIATEDYDEARRREYSALLLSNAGTSKGFTTCLSASASGLRYRMVRILHRKKRLFGILPAALMAAVIVLFFGVFNFAESIGTVKTEILDRDGGGWHIAAVEVVYDSKGEEADQIELTNSAVCQTIETQLADIRLGTVDNPYYAYHPYYGRAVVYAPKLRLTIQRGDERMNLYLTPGLLQINIPEQFHFNKEFYDVEAVDFDALMLCLNES